MTCNSSSSRFVSAVRLRRRAGSLPMADIARPPCTEDLLAHLHDWANRALQDDTQLYSDLATSVGGPVLELACGSGRVLNPLVATGVSVCGVDWSRAMLRRARARLTRHSAPVTLVHGDMRYADLPG